MRCSGARAKGREQPGLSEGVFLSLWMKWGGGGGWHCERQWGADENFKEAGGGFPSAAVSSAGRSECLCVCVCVWHAVCYRNCLFSCLFSHIFPLASSVWWVMWNDLQTVQVAVSIKLNCKKNIACPVVFLWKLRRRTNDYIKTGTCCPQTQPCA